MLRRINAIFEPVRNRSLKCASRNRSASGWVPGLEPLDARCLPNATVLAIREATGADVAAIAGAVDNFRADLGDPLNGSTPGTQPAGRRDINWDGVPDGDSSPGRFPVDFFNAIAPRGAIFSGGPRTTFQVSADADNPAAAPINFGNINPTYSTAFGTFSPQRLFTPVGSNVFDVEFFVPGTSEPAVVSGFGAVFTDVDRAGATTIEFFGHDGELLASREVLATPGDAGLSFLGVTFSEAAVSRVRLTLGDAALGDDDVTQNAANGDVVVVDDLIYGEPQGIAVVREAAGANAAAIQATVDAFRADLGNPLNGSTPGTQPAGRRDINWDGVPDANSAPGRFPGDFFNSVAPRGALLVGGTARTSLQVSADADNPAAAPINFGNVNPTYSTAFGTFSAQRLFAPLGSNVVEVHFVVPGTDVPATVTGFGAVFTDVDVAGSSRVEFFDPDGDLIFSRDVLPTPGDAGLSFVGATFHDAVVARVRLTVGAAALGADDVTQNAANPDVAALDDFIYGEPQALVVTPPPAESVLAVGGSNGSVRIVDSNTGATLISSFRPLDLNGTPYLGLLQVAFADMSGDGKDDLLVAPSGPAGQAGLAASKAGKVFVYDGAGLGSGVLPPTPIREFTPFANTDGPNGSTGPYINGLYIAAADVDGDGDADLIAGTRGGSAAAGNPEFGRFVVISGDSPAGQSVVIGAGVNPFGNGYQKGVVVAAGDIDGDGKAEVAVTRGGPVAATNLNRSLKVKAYRLTGGSLTELNLSGQVDGSGNPVAFAPFDGITGPNGEVIERDARVEFVDSDGNGKAELVVTALDRISDPSNTQVRIAAYAIDPVSGEATLVSTGGGATPTTYLTGKAVVDHAVARSDRDGNNQEELALLTESGVSGIRFLNPLTGASLGSDLVLDVLTGGVNLAGN